jgi:hypothetical protein
MSTSPSLFVFFACNAGPNFKNNMRTLRDSLDQDLDQHHTYIVPVTDVLGRYMTIERTDKQLIDSLNKHLRDTLNKLSTRGIAMEYYRLMSYCRQRDSAVDDTWRNCHSKVEQWDEFCDNCHLALLYYNALHDSPSPAYDPKPLHKDVTSIDHDGGQAGEDDDGQHLHGMQLGLLPEPR